MGKDKKKKNNPALSQNPASKKTALPATGFNQWTGLFGILTLTLVVFFPSLNNSFTNWDDPALITENPLIHNLDADSIKRIFSEVYFGNYQPLHILSYAIEYHFYGLNPTGYHATSIVMHLIATWLVCKFIFSLTQNSTIALLAALLFGIHPMHVESVAWAAERKDLLYSIFFIASLIVYIKYIRSEGKAKFLVFTFMLFALSIFSKAMAASLPPTLFLLDIYFKRKLSIKLVLEKVPFFALAAVLGFIATNTVSTTGQVSLHVFSLFDRIIFANFNILHYIGKLILPIQLSAFYPYPSKSVGGLPFYFYTAPFIVAGMAFLIIRALKKTKVIFFGAGFFILCIFLVLQLFPVGPTIISERYTYLPSIGFFFIIAYYTRQLIEKRPSFKTVVHISLVGYSLFLCVATWQRCEVWKDSMSLWTNVLKQFPNTGMALNNRGNVYGKERGELDLALADFNKSIAFEPDFVNAYANRGVVYGIKGKYDLAIKDFTKALELKPNYYEALLNRGITYSQIGQFDKAIIDFTRMLQTKKEDPKLYHNRGVAYLQNKQYNDAISDFNTELSLDPNLGDAYYQKAIALYNISQFKEAFENVQRAVSLGTKVDAKYFETIQQAAETNQK